MEVDYTYSLCFCVLFNFHNKKLRDILVSDRKQNSRSQITKGLLCQVEEAGLDPAGKGVIKEF